jgi:hypothetical protein
MFRTESWFSMNKRRLDACYEFRDFASVAFVRTQA